MIHLSRAPRTLYVVVCADGRVCSCPDHAGSSWEHLTAQPYSSAKQAAGVRKVLDEGLLASEIIAGDLDLDTPERAPCGPHRILRYVQKEKAGGEVGAKTHEGSAEMNRERVPFIVSRLVGGRPVRWAPARRLVGDFDGRERTLEVFNAEPADQHRLLALIDKERESLKRAAGGPLVIIFHSVRQSRERYADFLNSFRD